MLSKFVLISAFAALAVSAAPTEPSGVVNNLMNKCGDGPCDNASGAPGPSSVLPQPVNTLAPMPHPTQPAPPVPPVNLPVPVCEGGCDKPKPFESALKPGYALYQISPANNDGLCMSVHTTTKEGNWLSNNQPVILDKCDPTNTGQLWALPKAPDCDAPLNLAGSNFCVDSGTVAEGNWGPDNAAGLKVYKCYKDNGDVPIRSQHFRFGSDASVRMMDQHRQCDACIDFPNPNGKYSWGTPLQIWDCAAENPNQAWVRKPVDATPVKN